MPKTKLFVILATFNGEKWIQKSINSALNASTKNCEIIVVDNGSTDRTLEILKDKPNSRVKLIENPENRGFGQANNHGIKLALEQGASHIFLLNQDAWVAHNTFQVLLDRMEENPEFGLLSPMHYNGRGSALDHSFAVFFNRAKKFSEDQKSVNFVNAAAWMLSANCVRKVGLFHPAFFHYGEDNNYCDRLRFHGFKIGIVSSCSAFHDTYPKKNIQKDRIQGRYGLLNTLINLNHSLTTNLLWANIQLAGMIKHYTKKNGIRYFFSFACTLSGYFFSQIAGIKKIRAIRKRTKGAYGL